MNNFIKLLIIAIGIFMPHLSFAACAGSSPTWTAVSCNASAINDCVSAASPGDTINIPEGTCTWTCTTSCPSVSIKKPLNLIGAGEGSTVIIDNSTTGWQKNPLTISYTSDTATSTRISGFTFQHSVGGQDGDGAIQLWAWGTGPHSIRIDHLTVNGVQRWLHAGGTNIKGLLDNLTVTSSALLFDGSCDSEWTHTWTMGTDDAWYIEDSTFNFVQWADGITDCRCGARYVFRHNTVNMPSNSSFQGYLVGNHGYDTSNRSCMGQEIYENTFTNNGPTYPSAVQYRGGTGVVFNNTILGSNWNPPLQITYYRSCAGFTADAKGMCDGTHGTDGNVDHGWPCRDQIGRAGNQASVPLYEWDNCRDATCSSGGKPVHFTLYNGYTGDCSYLGSYHVKSSRDYFNNTKKPGYTPYPYPYPHPLTLISPQLSAPSAPQFLKAN